jgi:uncharacterized SAM-binding protein YcdF (DUF218 family)
MIRLAIGIGGGILALVPIAIFARYYRRGQQFALRDPLQKADAIVALAGTRGNIEYLNGKVRTAVRLYQEGWAPRIIFTGRFSRKVTDSPQLIPRHELELAANQGRIDQSDVGPAAETWDEALGARYMRDLAIQLGVPATMITTEEQSLHTLENATFTAKILQEQRASSIILVTSPFHQARTFLTFRKVLQPFGISIMNHYADTDEWHSCTWFLSAKNRSLVASETQRIRRYHGTSHTTISR